MANSTVTIRSPRCGNHGRGLELGVESGDAGACGGGATGKTHIENLGPPDIARNYQTPYWLSNGRIDRWDTSRTKCSRKEKQSKVGGLPGYDLKVSVSTRRCAAAVARNREPIAEAMRSLLPARGSVLEISSGTGEHAAYLSSCFPALDWQPTELEAQSLESIEAWRTDGSPGLRSPLLLDTCWETWPVERADVIVNINMIHISPWKSCSGLMRGAGRLLDTGGLLYLYGPFRLDRKHTSASNREFDEWLRGRDPEWGVRDLADVTGEAKLNGLLFEQKVAMPANNFSVIFRRK